MLQQDRATEIDPIRDLFSFFNATAGSYYHMHWVRISHIIIDPAEARTPRALGIFKRKITSFFSTHALNG
jgi:hypothetical protein